MNMQFKVAEWLREPTNQMDAWQNLDSETEFRTCGGVVKLLAWGARGPCSNRLSNWFGKACFIFTIWLTYCLIDTKFSKQPNRIIPQWLSLKNVDAVQVYHFQTSSVSDLVKAYHISQLINFHSDVLLYFLKIEGRKSAELKIARIELKKAVVLYYIGNYMVFIFKL